jgi:ATP-binding cassette subfamily C (CFTR/MRP) protein 1
LEVVCGVISTYVGKAITPRQRRWMQAIQKRIGLTTGSLSTIKEVKMSDLSRQIVDQIQDARNLEIEDQNVFRRLQITNITIGQYPASLSSNIKFTF